MRGRVGITGPRPWEGACRGLYSPEMSPNNAENDPDSGLRDRLAEEVAAEAAFEGFGRKSLTTAAERLALPRGEADRLFPGGALQVLEHLSRRSDERTVE